MGDIKVDGKTIQAPLKKKLSEIDYDAYQNKVYETTIRRTIAYLAFVILVGLIATNVMSTSKYYFRKAMRDVFIQRPFVSGSSVINFENIKSALDFWAYCESVLSNGLHSEYRYDDNKSPAGEEDKKIMYENLVVGVARIRQLRVRNGSCPIHSYFRDIFVSCYADFSPNAENRSNLRQEGSLDRQGIYKTEEETGSLSYEGKLANYHGGGVCENLGQDLNTTKDILQRLKSALWLTRATKLVAVEFTAYNANINLFCVVKLAFEFPPFGGVVPSSTFDVISCLLDSGVYGYFIIFFKLIMITYLVLYAFTEFVKIYQLGGFYFFKFWNLIEVLILWLGFIGLGLDLFQYIHLEKAMEKFRDAQSEYANFEKAAYIQSKYSSTMALFSFFVHIKLFKYLCVNKMMRQLNKTLTGCSFEIFSFFIMFSIIFLAYSELGYLIFGAKVLGFSTLSESMFSLYRIILGDFDYFEIEEADRTYAPLFFVTYIFLVFFVLMNMFLAIINDTYVDVKTKEAITPDNLSVVDYVQKAATNLFEKWKIRKEIAPKFISNRYDGFIENTATTLKVCGFTESEIDAALSPFNDGTKSDRKNMEKIIQNYLETHGAQTVPKGLVFRRDLEIQQEKLTRIENITSILTNRVNVILQLLGRLQNVQQSTAN